MKRSTATKLLAAASAAASILGVGLVVSAAAPARRPAPVARPVSVPPATVPPTVVPPVAGTPVAPRPVPGAALRPDYRPPVRSPYRPPVRPPLPAAPARRAGA
jgi:hypothetical protein